VVESEESSSGGDIGVDAESERSGTEEDTESQTEGADDEIDKSA